MTTKAKEIHYYYSFADYMKTEAAKTCNYLLFYEEVITAINNGVEIIHTTIPSFLSWSCGERLFIHCNGKVKEVIKGVDAREAQDVEKMFFSGCFGMIDEEEKICQLELDQE